ncbi:polyhydroxyalkanoate biosynthesis repressor PhaR [Alteromonas sediminis]|uniref:Polyhydroxyalkanoate biosynthesis repressor PhaR n=1 Tax=Alteromonas sediminis TaxID=2259342 RepID=A0A3N5XX75_9ALTE|nr:N-acetylneuraminate synthase family protein [Alteromonas sediminis]RPJ64983.1 polyhydroxyalkanoate biosynthesis repressor PhaR [Alteromonas sediminis]
MNDIEINGRKIGSEHSPLVIVEIGINHGGSLDVAKQMVDAALYSGAEIIKHQTHVLDDEMSQAAKQVVPGNASESIYDVMKNNSLTEQQEWELQEYVESKGLTFISTPFSRAAADRLQEMKVPAFKIGSGECNNIPLIKHIARFKKPMIVSTGMNSLESVRATVEAIESIGTPYALMHTTNLYPTPSHLVRLGAMQELMRNFSNVPIGLSDHTTSNLACFAAVAQGASIVERHFTDHMYRSGPDIINSMDSVALRELIVGVSEIHKMLGGEKRPAAEEKVTSDFAFATVVAIAPIAKGEKLSADNIWVKRPGTGHIPAADYEKLIGKTALTDIDSDMHLCWEHFS